jgi:hypothetical protein
MKYIYPKLSSEGFDFGLFRIGAYSGLGNLLCVYAKAIIYSKLTNSKIINPTWPQLEFRFLFKKNKRNYFNLFNTPSEYISGIEKLIKLNTLPHYKEKNVYNSFRKNHIIDVEWNHENYINNNDFEGVFTPLIEYRNYIFNNICKISKKKHRIGLKYNFNNSITVHVRRGDFKSIKKETGLEWFIDKITQIRSNLSKNIQVYIFSDGNELELNEILSLNNCKRLSFGSSLADLLAMSNSKILIASGGSSFSKWASFLGNMPAIWPYKPTDMKLKNEFILDNNEKIPQSFYKKINFKQDYKY